MRQLLGGATSVSVVIRMIDSVDGTPETGVTTATAGIAFNYRRELSAVVAITPLSNLAALTTAFTANGLLHIGDGYYRLDLPDAAVASGQRGVLITGTATGMVVLGEYIELVAYDPYNAIRLGLTALPNAVAEAAGGLYTRGTGAGQINQPANGMIDGNVVRWLNTAVATPATAGIPRVAIEAAGDFIQAAADKVWASATRTLTAFSLTLAQTIWDVLAASVVAANSIGLQIKTNLDAAVSSRSTYAGGAVASVTGAVGSVTGAVGSVTGNVGGNVTGSVGSVVGAVGSVTGNVGGNVTGSVGSIATNGISAASLAVDSGQKPIRSNTAQTGSTTTTLILDTGASAVDDFYNHTWVVITGGTGVGQVRRIRDYTGSTKVAAVARAWITTPDNTSTFAILPTTSVWDEFVADHATAGTFGNVSGQQLTTSELIDNLVGPLATVQANGANTATVFQVDIPTVAEGAANWWNDAWLSFDLTSALAGQVKKITAFNQTTGMVTVASAFTAIPTTGNTARIVTR